MRCALLHGFVGDVRAWDGVIAAWSADASPVAIALPGHGGGDVAASWDANIASVASAVERASPGCDTAIGYSMGARIALGLLARGAITRAVLISGNPGIDDAERPARIASDAAWAALLRERGITAFVDAWQAQPLFADQHAPADALAARTVRRRTLDGEQLARCLEVMGLGAMPDFRAQLPGWRERIAVLAGARDAKFAAIARAMPAARCDLVADAGHDPTIEQPRALAAAIAQGIAAVGG